MQKIILIPLLFCLTLAAGCQKQTQNRGKFTPKNSSPTVNHSNANQPNQNRQLSECEKAGGKLTVMEECDGSRNDYCTLSGQVHCYADQIKDGKCAVEFSEQAYNETGDGMVGPGSGPRVLCDNEQ